MRKLALRTEPSACVKAATVLVVPKSMPMFCMGWRLKQKADNWAMDHIAMGERYGSEELPKVIRTDFRRDPMGMRSTSSKTPRQGW